MISLSIIVPVYNKVLYLEACLKSILAQTYSEFELILINDGSNDGSEKLCDRYAALDQRISVIHQVNTGVSAARNSGIQAAKGQFIGFVDSDDTIEADMYQLLMVNIIASHADVAVCRLRTISGNKIDSPAEALGPYILNHQQALSANIKGELDRSANNKIYKTELVRIVEFEGSIYEDILFTNRVLMKSRQTVVENLVKYNYMVRDNSASMQIFHSGYSQTIQTSSKILEMVACNEPCCLEEARAFDAATNLSLLNLILLSGKSSAPSLYKRVHANLFDYRKFISTTKLISKKHQYALKLFYASPALYMNFLKLYCLVKESDALKRTSK